MAIRFLRKAAAMLERHRTGCLIVSCAGLFGANLAFHIFPEQTCRTLYQAWAKGKPVEPSERLLRLFSEVLSDVTVETDKGYQAFVTFSFHPVSAGLPWLPAGCVVGIPANFGSSAKDESEISAHVIVIKGKEVDWESPEGLALKEALTLSPAAQKFAIAREIVYVKNHSPLICAAIAPVFLAGTYGSAVAMKGLLGLYSGPVQLRGLCNIVVLALGYVGYCLSYDTVSQAADYRADRNTATISTDFARGGVEFYNKILSQNQTFRTLMGKQGKKIYAPNGNLFPRHWIRFKHASYTSRRDLIINILNMPQA
ncbi:transmembrane protein 177 [Varanus komodoensis]|uniref:Transmembrane protein 177 n=1 Tax=Varanus komodoensis TaxID=61221 RepID=A0A8D2J523_VARKO|nr:transmembrane protein 177 [Varanus komodoensis]XP_044293887.1 transmembrane protein 177 [Varanus komodoensis]XP_044293888.1 transmembrane protein 177 [Varanus komodoensis]XP_044293890.1 transmembrane protein 177 [Varanus komodoensis]